MNDELNKFFRFKCGKGLKAKGLNTKVYKDRLEYEISIIEKMGFFSYFLIVSDFLNWARAQNILVGPGRGSVAGSLVAYSLNITVIDPIKYGLIFERFLNPSRISMPDADCDFQDDRRDEVIEYVREKYGSKHVGHISTYGTMKCKGAIKAVARTLGADYVTGDLLSKLTPPPVDGHMPSLEKCYQEVPKLAAFHNKPESPEGKILNWADRIEDRIDKVGVHASGIVIANTELTDVVPLMIDKHGKIATQWDMNEIEKAGLVKFDFLGLTILTVISKAIELIKQQKGVVINIDTIPIDDIKVFTNLQNGDTSGCFQIETSSGIRDLMIKMKPKNMLDLATLIAVYRPGPLSNSYKDTWLRIRNGLEDTEYVVPKLKPILEETSGFLIFQEQAMRIAVDIAGYTLPESDSLRKAIGKKKPEEMALHESKFKNGAIKNGYKEKVANQLWEEIKAFAAYGFVKGHAVAYAYLVYQTAWLKTHYPVQYMCAALTCNKNNTDQIIKYIFDCRERGINIVPPDINDSDVDFSIDKQGKIRFGLSAIKNLGEEIVQSIINLRKIKKFASLEDLISRVDTGKLNKRKLESLILAGALDSFGTTRSAMIDMINQFIDHKKEHKAFESKMNTYQKKLESYNARNEEIRLAEIVGLKTKLKAFKQPTKPEEPTRPTIRNLSELSEKELLAAEKELIGYYISGHPIAKYKTMISNNSNLSIIQDIKSTAENNNIVNLFAIPTSISERTVKSSGKKMASVLLEDCTGAIEAIMFPGTWEKYGAFINIKDPLQFKCKVTLNDNSDVITVPELIIMDLVKLPDMHINKEMIDVHIPLKFGIIGKVAKLLDKYSGEETKLNIEFTTQGQVNFGIDKIHSIKSKELFLIELNDIIN